MVTYAWKSFILTQVAWTAPGTLRVAGVADGRAVAILCTEVARLQLSIRAGGTWHVQDMVVDDRRGYGLEVSTWFVGNLDEDSLVVMCKGVDVLADAVPTP